ncbi:MAG TPA: hypothetical protein VL977_06335 [Solirubrobacteraceae bacterium]|nr:hypothetical protein [Solirubrobacteraceae bacterium]
MLARAARTWPAAGSWRERNAARCPLLTLERAAWWEIRRAANRKPATYRCPICGGRLPALSEHMLLMPEGDSSRRRHAHSACVMRARAAGRLPLREDWLAAQPRRPSLWQRLRQARRDGRDAQRPR